MGADDFGQALCDDLFFARLQLRFMLFRCLQTKCAPKRGFQVQAWFWCAGKKFVVTKFELF